MKNKPHVPSTQLEKWNIAQALRSQVGLPAGWCSLAPHQGALLTGICLPENGGFSLGAEAPSAARLRVHGAALAQWRCHFCNLSARRTILFLVHREASYSLA